LAEKTKEAANQAQEVAAEIGRLLTKVEKLKGELAPKDEELARETEACKQDTAQAYLVRFEEAIRQVSGLYLDLDYSQLGLGKVVVDGQLRDG